MGNAELGNLVGFHTMDLLPIECDRTRCGFDHATDGSHGGGFTRTIGANQGDHLSFGYVQGDAVQDMNFTVPGFELFDL